MQYGLFSTLSNSKSLESLKSADFGLFGATWWPNASLERLRIVTYLAVWVSILVTLNSGVSHG